MPRRNQRDDQDVQEFMGELRVALPGAEVLFAFLLTLPFTARFGILTVAERSAYFVAFIAAAAACILLIAPSSLRQFFPEAGGRSLLRICARLAVTGLAALGVCLTAVVFLVGHVLYGRVLASSITAVAAGGVLVLWYGLPLWRRRRPGQPDSSSEG